MWDEAVAAAVLKASFGFNEFKGFQRDVLRALVQGSDVLCVAATGAGKSLCFQFLTQYARRRGKARSCTAVVSPLIALMEDQVRGLRERGINAVALSSSLSLREDWERMARCEFDVVYLTPEGLRGWLPTAQALAAAGQLDMVCCDEAHCVSEWGSDFRPEYRAIGDLRDAVPSVPMLALTATATPAVREDIIASLRLRAPRRFVSSFNRPNLTYEVRMKGSGAEADLRWALGRMEGSVIVYAPTRELTERLAASINGMRLPLAGAAAAAAAAGAGGMPAVSDESFAGAAGGSTGEGGGSSTAAGAAQQLHGGDGWLSARPDISVRSASGVAAVAASAAAAGATSAAAVAAGKRSVSSSSSSSGSAAPRQLPWAGTTAGVMQARFGGGGGGAAGTARVSLGAGGSALRLHSAGGAASAPAPSAAPAAGPAASAAPAPLAYQPPGPPLPPRHRLAAHYHAGMSPPERSRVYADFLHGRVHVLVGTVAAGMGLDVPWVRGVVCYGATKTLESFYQQTGRAGRDGDPAQCVLFWSAADFAMNANLISKSAGLAAAAAAAAGAPLQPAGGGAGGSGAPDASRGLAAMRAFCETGGCRRRFLLEYFGELAPKGASGGSEGGSSSGGSRGAGAGSSVSSAGGAAASASAAADAAEAAFACTGCDRCALAAGGGAGARRHDFTRAFRVMCAAAHQFAGYSGVSAVVGLLVGKRERKLLEKLDRDPGPRHAPGAGSGVTYAEAAARNCSNRQAMRALFGAGRALHADADFWKGVGVLMMQQGLAVSTQREIGGGGGRGGGGGGGPSCYQAFSLTDAGVQCARDWFALEYGLADGAVAGGAAPTPPLRSFDPLPISADMARFFAAPATAARRRPESGAHAGWGSGALSSSSAASSAMLAPGDSEEGLISTPADALVGAGGAAAAGGGALSAAAAALFSGFSRQEVELYELLVAVRSAIRDGCHARGLATPLVHNIATDRTLRLLARARPASAPALLAVEGMTEQRLRDYGPLLLAGIRKACARLGLQTHDLPPSAAAGAGAGAAAGAGAGAGADATLAVLAPPTALKPLTPAKLQAWEAVVLRGVPPATAATAGRAQAIKPDTVLGYVSDCLEAGYHLQDAEVAAVMHACHAGLLGVPGVGWSAGMNVGALLDAVRAGEGAAAAARLYSRIAAWVLQRCGVNPEALTAVTAALQSVAAERSGKALPLLPFSRAGSGAESGAESGGAPAGEEALSPSETGALLASLTLSPVLALVPEESLRSYGVLRLLLNLLKTGLAHLYGPGGSGGHAQHALAGGGGSSRAGGASRATSNAASPADVPSPPAAFPTRAVGSSGSGGIVPQGAVSGGLGISRLAAGVSNHGSGTHAAADSSAGWQGRGPHTTSRQPSAAAAAAAALFAPRSLPLLNAAAGVAAGSASGGGLQGGPEGAAAATSSGDSEDIECFTFTAPAPALVNRRRAAVCRGGSGGLADVLTGVGASGRPPAQAGVLSIGAPASAASAVAAAVRVAPGGSGSTRAPESIEPASLSDELTTRGYSNVAGAGTPASLSRPLQPSADGGTRANKAGRGGGDAEPGADASRHQAADFAGQQSALQRAVPLPAPAGASQLALGGAAAGASGQAAGGAGEVPGLDECFDDLPEGAFDLEDELVEALHGPRAAAVAAPSSIADTAVVPRSMPVSQQERLQHLSGCKRARLPETDASEGVAAEATLLPDSGSAVKRQRQEAAVCESAAGSAGGVQRGFEQACAAELVPHEAAAAVGRASPAGGLSALQLPSVEEFLPWLRSLLPCPSSDVPQLSVQRWPALPPLALQAHASAVLAALVGDMTVLQDDVTGELLDV
jgi:superfamily II DNA helicase RecQ